MEVDDDDDDSDDDFIISCLRSTALDLFNLGIGGKKLYEEKKYLENFIDEKRKIFFDLEDDELLLSDDDL